jgi:hypothetical protein
MNPAKVYRMSEHTQQHDDPLNLRSLPPLESGHDGWPAIATALAAQRRQRWRRVAVVGLPVAAALLLALGLGLRPSPPGPLPADAGAQMAAAEATAVADSAAGAGALALDKLIALSQRMESRLRVLRYSTGTLPAGSVVHQVELEDLVVQLDEELSRNPADLGLWRQRVSLLMDLETLYTNNLRREYHQMASL